MPTKEQLESALRNADAAGDVEAAKQLANALKAMEPVQVEVINQPNPQTLLGKAADLFTGESRMTKEIENMPEIGSAPELNEFSMAALKSSLGALMSGDPTDIKGVLSKNYPDAQFREDAKGNLIADLPSGSYVLNRPGMTPADIIRGVFDVAAFTPVGRATVSAPTLAAKVATGAIGSGAVEAGRQVGVEALGGEGNAADVAIATTTGGAFELLGPVGRAAVNKIRTARQSRAAARQSLESATFPESVKQAAKSQETTEKTGVQFFRGQQTLDPYQIEEQAFVAQLPEGSRRAMEALRNQDTQTAQAVESFMDSIAPRSSVATARTRIRGASNRAIELAKQARREAANPQYQQAFREFRETGSTIDTAPIMDDIALRLRQFPEGHPAHKALLKFKDQIQENASDLEKLQGVKEMIDIEIANTTSAPNARSMAAVNKANAQVAAVQDLLLGQMDATSDTFRQARQTYAKESVNVDALRDSVVGIVANMDNVQLKNASKRLFDPAEATTDTVRKARAAILGTENGREHWDAIIRSEVESRLGSAKNTLDQVIAGDQRAIQNMPAQMLNAIYGNAKSKEVLLSAMDDAQRENFNFLEDALKRAATGRPGGSQTGVRREISERLGKGFINGIRRFISSPIETVAEIGEEGARQARIRAVADAAFDPTWNDKMSQIRKLQRAGQFTKAEKMTVDLLNKVEDAVSARTVLQASMPDSED